MLPPLIQCSRSRGGCGSSQHDVQKRGDIDWRSCRNIESDSGCQQHKQCEPCLDQFGNVACEFATQVGGLVGRERGCFHIRASSLRLSEETTTPSESMIAPTATCVVATSAALLLQIVQAPRKTCTKTRTIHRIDSR